MDRLKWIMVRLAVIYGVGYAISIVVGIMIGGWFIYEYGPEQAGPEAIKFWTGILP